MNIFLIFLVPPSPFFVHYVRTYAKNTQKRQMRYHTLPNKEVEDSLLLKLS